jgi:hypothetical protein
MKPYSELTDRGRAGRARRMVAAALFDYGLEGSRIRFLAAEWNLLFRIDTPDGGSPARDHSYSSAGYRVSPSSGGCRPMPMPGLAPQPRCSINTAHRSRADGISWLGTESSTGLSSW